MKPAVELPERGKGLSALPARPGRADSASMAVLVILALVVVVFLLRAVRGRPPLAEPLPMLSEDYTGPMVVKAPRARRLVSTAPSPAGRTDVAA